MKHYAKTTREVRTLTHTTCDSCDKTIGKEPFAIEECHFESRIGVGYPDYVDIKVSEFDLCGDCAEKILAVMKEMGINVRERDIE